MAEANRQLLAWAFGAFHAAAFFVPVLLLVHRAGSLESFLGAIGTVRGLLIYGAILGYSWLAARETLRDVVLDPLPAGRDALALLPRALFWGGATGALSVVTAGLVIVLPAPLPVALAVVFALSFASMFAFLVGVVVALVLALVDYALVQLARDIIAREVRPE